VAADGAVDVETMRLCFAFDGFLDAVERGDLAAAARVRDAWPADGRELFRSKKLGADQLEPFDLDVSGVGTLSLETEDGGDGNNSDWGSWFEPELLRR
jgi:hypothetical protein